jgi:DEAD/DEAH box helicase domain-containing protein
MPNNVKVVLRKLLEKEQKRGTLTAVVERPAQEARYGGWPAHLRPELRSALEARGMLQLYCHQSEAIEAIAAGQNVVVVTPTASGKTMCYNLPVLQAVLEDEGARAMYLFPTKALAQDQLAELTELTRQIDSLSLGAFTYDGDTPSDARRSVRSRGHVVITNPDMLHTGILPHHTKWSRFFANLRYIVVDELHTYRGVFGSHLANVFRRLQRICKFHGSSPIFILCSATIANPRELAEKLIEQPVIQIDQNGAPSGEKTIIFYNPPMLNKELGIRRSYVTASRRLATLFLKESIKTIVFAGSRLNVEVLTRYLKDHFERNASEQGRIRGYRGGYLPGLRREIERGLREGTVNGVVSTNALELGIDVGSLDVAILAGYPGTVASTWQQAGRAGRRQGASAVILVARSDPNDQFLMQNPDYFFGASPEQARINPDNLAILLSHIKCAAFELPLEVGERLGTAEITEITEYLAEKGVLHHSGDQYHWSQQVYPADTISLRSASPENFVIMDLDQNSKVIAEVDFHSAPSTVYEDAIYLCEAKTYNVKQLDYAQRRAYVRPVEVDYFTDAITSTAVTILDSFQATGFPEPTEAAPRSLLSQEHGEVHVSWRVSGFKKIKFYSRENVGYGEVHLPDHEMHTTAFWLTLSEEMLVTLGFARADLLDGVVGLAYCLHHLAPIYLMCDVRDLDRCVGDRAATWFARPGELVSGRYTFQKTGDTIDENVSENWMRVGAGNPESQPALQAALAGLSRFDPTLFLYDNYPGGMGFSPQIFDSFHPLLTRARALLDSCLCSGGCPSCVGPPQEVGSRAREVATAVAGAVLQQMTTPMTTR